MTDYAKLTLFPQYSKSSDYSNSRIPADFFDAVELTPDNYDYREIDVTTTAYTVDLSQFNTVTAIVVQNTTDTNYVNLTYMCQIGTHSAGSLDLAANDTPETITDNTAGGVFLTEGAVAGGWVRIASAEDSGNDGLFLMSNAAADVLTLSPATALATDNTTDTAATLSFEQKNKIRLAASDGIFVLKGNVVVAGDLILQAVTGTCEVRLLILGT